MTTSTLTRLAPTQVELEIPITAEELAAAEDRAFKKLVKNVKLPGFRAGHVPRKVFEANYGSHTINSQAMDDIVPEVYEKALREHSLDPVDRPKMELLPTEEGKPTRLKATVDVRPQIDLGEYKGMAVEREPIEITDEDVDRSIAALAKERATLVPVERAAALGDVVTIDYEGKIDGVAFDGGTAKGQMTELEESRFIPGFASGIAGMNPGETRDVEAVFPENYGEATLAGKTAVFTIVLHDVKALEIPSIDDEFAKSISQNESVEALREDVRKRLHSIAEGRGRRAVGNTIMDKLLERVQFPLPEVLVEREIDHMINEDGGESEKTPDELRPLFRNDAEMRVKGTLLIEAIAKAENIHATPADIAEELSSLARQYGQPVDRIRKALGNNVLSLMDGIVRNKTLDFLIDNAKVTEKKK